MARSGSTTTRAIVRGALVAACALGVAALTGCASTEQESAAIARTARSAAEHKAAAAHARRERGRRDAPRKVTG